MILISLNWISSYCNKIKLCEIFAYIGNIASVIEYKNIASAKNPQSRVFVCYWSFMMLNLIISSFIQAYLATTPRYFLLRVLFKLFYICISLLVIAFWVCNSSLEKTYDNPILLKLEFFNLKAFFNINNLSSSDSRVTFICLISFPSGEYWPNLWNILYFYF